jgi:phage portal protein BeeE
MAALIETLAPRSGRSALSFDDWTSHLGLEGLPFALQTTLGPIDEEVPDGSFTSLVVGAYLRNSVVFACLAVRARLFSQARFQFQQLRGGRPGALFGTPDLRLLERPEPGQTTSDLLQWAILDADLGGGGFILGQPDAFTRMRPDWTKIAYGSKSGPSEFGLWDPKARIIGYGHQPGGPSSGSAQQVYGADEVAHFAPTKDPLARNRGISLLVAGIREVMGDNAATTHKRQLMTNAATPNLALKFPPSMSKEDALEWIELFEQEHRGALNAWKTVYLGMGIEPTPIGMNFQQMDYTKLMGAAETRIAALTGMHPVVVALSEGLAGSSLNAGNFGSAARLVGDATLRPLWGDISGSLETIVTPPPGTRLWYDERDIAFLRSDVKDQADIIQKNASTIGQLIKDGFEPQSAIDAVVAGDMTRLQHTGLVSVQLQAPGTSLPASPVGYRARRDFWAVDDPFARLGTIALGSEVPADHPLVVTFPSLFEPVLPQVEDAAGHVRRLRSEGLSVPAIAARIERTERQVYRLLSEGAR